MISLTSSRYIATTHGLSVTSIEFRVRRRKGGGETGGERRDGHPSREKIYVTTHARMTECVLSVCVHPDVFTCGAAVLGTCSWAVTPYARTKKEGMNAPREKEFRGARRKGRREIKRERGDRAQHPSLIDEHRSH